MAETTKKRRKRIKINYGRLAILVLILVLVGTVAFNVRRIITALLYSGRIRAGSSPWRAVNYFQFGACGAVFIDELGGFRYHPQASAGAFGAKALIAVIIAAPHP